MQENSTECAFQAEKKKSEISHEKAGTQLRTRKLTKLDFFLLRAVQNNPIMINYVNGKINKTQ